MGDVSLAEVMRFLVIVCEVMLVLGALYLVVITGFCPDGWMLRFGSAVSCLFRRFRRQRSKIVPVVDIEPSPRAKPDLHIVRDKASPSPNTKAGGTVYYFPGPGARKSGRVRGRRPPPEKSN